VSPPDCGDEGDGDCDPFAQGGFDGGGDDGGVGVVVGGVVVPVLSP
jgi:hypothetical protein